jgi:hypothetical protein
VLSIVAPAAAIWHFQLQQNEADGEERQHLIRRDELVRDIQVIAEEGERYNHKATDARQKLHQIAEQIRADALKEYKGAEQLDVKQLAELQKIMSEAQKLFIELAKLEAVDPPDKEAIRRKDEEIDHTILRLTMGMPQDVTDAAKAVISAARLSNELDRLTSADKPNQDDIKQKEAELETASDAAQHKRRGCGRKELEAGAAPPAPAAPGPCRAWPAFWRWRTGWRDWCGRGRSRTTPRWRG